MKNFKENINNIFQNSGFRRYFTSTSWLLGERILRIIAGLFVYIYVARYLGPEKYGLYSYIIAFVALFGPISSLGLEEILVKNLVKNIEKKLYYLGTAFWLKFIGAILAFSVIILVIQFLSNDKTTNFYILIVASGLIFQPFQVINFYFRSIVLSKYVSLCLMAQLIFSSLLKLFFIYIEADLFWFVLVTLLDYILLAISYMIIYIFKKNESFFKNFKISIAKKLFISAWPLIISSVMIVIYMKIDQVMIKELLSDKDVGLYSVVVKISESWYFVPTVITGSFFPAIINAKRKSEKIYYQRIQHLYDLILWLTIIVAIPITIFSDEIIITLFGIEFLSAADILSVHIWQGVFVGLGVASAKWLIAENLQKVLTLNTIIGALLNVSLNFVLIPKMGIMGAAISTIISYSFAVFFFLFFYKKTRKNVHLLLNSFNFLRLVRVIKK